MKKFILLFLAVFAVIFSGCKSGSSSDPKIVLNHFFEALANKNIDQAKNVYNDAFKQLSTGNDNLISQTQKLKSLGIKNKNF